MQFNQKIMLTRKYTTHTDLVRPSVLAYCIHASHPVPNSNQIHYVPFRKIPQRSFFVPLNAHSHTMQQQTFKTNDLFYCDNLLSGY